MLFRSVIAEGKPTIARGPAEELDDPFLPNTTNVPVEPGMTMNLEASNHEAGWGTVQVEYTCAVTQNGTNI